MARSKRPSTGSILTRIRPAAAKAGIIRPRLMKRGANGSADVGVKPQAAYHVAQKRVEADRFGPPLFCDVTSRHVDENGSQTVAHRRALDRAAASLADLEDHTRP